MLSRAPQPLRLPAVEKGARTTGRRKAFAEWLTQPEHPLTARVMVNRIWAGHFGTGLVASLDNFGKSGAAPTHPELLDWLATEFVREGWSLKKLHKTIVLSAAYRQSAESRADGLAKDAENKLLWRMSPRRLEAESVRDAVLAVADRLDATMFGEPVKTVTKPSGEVVPEKELEQPGRRTVYQLVRRSAPQSLLNAFDAPVMEINCARRVTTTSATQALAMMNSDFMGAQAEHFARRLLKQPGEDRARVEQAFRIAFSRPPTATEADRLLTFLRTQEAFYQQRSPNERRLQIYRDVQSLLGANEFIYLD